MKPYLNGEIRTRLAYLLDINILYESLINSNSLTKDEKTELKHACTRHQKGIALIKKRMPKEFEKIERMLKDNLIVMKPKTQELIDRRAIYMEDDRLRDILEVMINDHCIGCKIENYLDCIIYQYNDDLDVSSMYNEPKGVCPYAYMGEKEKALNPTYGTIFKPRACKKQKKRKGA
ncbi:hypothetical protein [Acetobacterium wieringae]|uniref:hypothetical protein n=1 Tax=Acetobacterium wieringae TaxID=52694 RepID=UPI0020340590|nr:hypothetical protein [Acetobacterium wieringae]URN85844.1 hypothetical protein CHL1_001518 [Acetobacterium wieringae]